MIVGIYAGSFDILTKGHIAIAQKALTLVDELHIVVADNPQKKYMMSSELRVAIIKSQFKSQRVYVTYTNGLVVDYAASLGEVCFLVRGIRNMTDMMQELNLADINQELSGFSTFFIPTSNEFRNVSSSFVKELFHHGKDISKYVPKEVIDVLKMVGE